MAAQGAGFTVLPQYQGNLYDIQTKQALAQALMQKGLTGSPELYRPQGGGYQYVPQIGIGGLLAQALQGYVGGELQHQAGQEMSQLGQQQWNSLLGAMGGGTPASSAATQSVASPGTAAGGSYSVGAVDPQRAALANALAPQQAGSSPLNPAGLPPQLAVQAYMTDPAAYFKEFVAPNYKPAEIQSQIRAAGIDPTSPLGRQVAQQSLAKANYQAPIAGGPGTTYRDPYDTNKVLATNPMVGENQEVLYDAQGRPVIRTIPGAAQSAEELARANAMGKAGAEPIAGVDANGNPTFTTKAAVAQGSGAQGQAPAAGRFGGYQAPGGVRPGLSPAEQEGQIGLAKGNVANYNALKEQAGTSAERTNILDVLNSYAEGNTKFGPGWTQRIENLAALNSKLPSGLAFGSDSVANAQVVQKLASNLIQQYQKSIGSGGTDKQMELVMHGTPGADMTNKAMLEVIPKLKSMELALQSKANAADSWLAANNNNPAALNKFETTWRQSYDPRIFQMSMMDPVQRGAFLGQQKDSASLKSKIQTFLNNGWVQ